MGEYKVQSNVAIISIKHPPMNSLSAPVCQALYKFMETAEKDSMVNAIVICGIGRNFSAGADITEFGGSSLGNRPNLQDVIKILENCKKPVIAAIHGYCLGGGLEVALGCHFRVALSSAIFGFPEVSIGILPAAGGTQSFPRLVGLKNAIEWITTGKHYTAQTAANIGVLDRMYPASSDIVDCALQFSQTVLKKNLLSRRISRMPVRDAGQVDAIIAAAKQKLALKARGAKAPSVCLQSICNSLTLPYSEGLDKESELFIELQGSGQSQALRYAFFAERMVGKWEAPNGINYKNSTPMKVNKLAVIGLGTMGSGIAISLSTLGRPVFVLESDEKVLSKAVQSIYAIIDRMAKRGEITYEQCEAMQRNIIPCTAYSQLKDVDLVVEAVFESMKLKKDIFRQLDNACKPSAILATNTSTLDIDVLGSQTKRPDKVAGMHFFAPAHRMKLLENIRSSKSSPQTLATIMDIGKQIRKCTVLVGNCHGFVGNRMYGHYMLESDFILEEGAYPQQVDSVLRDYGFTMGRYEVGDLSGNDVSYRVRRERGHTQEKAKKQGIRYSPMVDMLYERGRYGVKAGRGWYNFVGGKFCVDSEVTEMIELHRRQQNITARKIQPQEILERCLYPMVNEGFKILEDGIASSPQAIDMIWIYGYAWPKYTGGPMYYANTVGLPRVLEVIEDHWRQAGKSEPHWEPSAMLVNLVKNYGNPDISQWMDLHRESVKSHL